MRNQRKAMALELDLDKIAKTGWQLEDENIRFRTFLKEKDPDSIDAVVHALNDEIAPQIDCTQCGNCCRELKPAISERDLSRLAMCLNVPAESITDDYIEEMEDRPHFKHLPCVFLKDCKCTVYPDRPDDCRSFPYLHEKGFTSRLWKMIDFYSICPIVFNVFERLKNEVGFE